ncbi:isoleucine--tRNA ligase [Candidatus Woesearchaeota archaeon]|nr:isoleucine--tRNA ligase [Candidatus Woesearchaeota archaeon]
MGQYDFRKNEDEILKFWADNNIYETARKKGKKKFYFLQGPPYTSGRIHIGTAWNNALKDIILRYKRMNDFNVWDRAGYDMHGLPTENKVQKDFKLKFKEDIKKYGEAKFIKKCIEFSRKNAEIMSKDLWKLGVWMDYENAYLPIRNEFIEGEWLMIKKAEEKKLLYKDKKVMTWCASCETNLAKHELEYKNIEDDSIFLRFRTKKDEFLIVWTTTPWTIPFNLAVMVNPELDYVKAEIKDGKYEGEKWITAKALVGAVIGKIAESNFKIIDEFKGEKLEGLKYEHPLKKDIKFPQSENLHSVILSGQYVDTSAGSGLVHCAPGCGPEDFEVGRNYGLKPFNELDEKGNFSKKMGKFYNWNAKRDNKKFIDALKKSLIAVTKVEHEYPFCWRCHNPVVFRTTDQWFLNLMEIKNKILKLDKKIKWVPSRENDSFRRWVENLRDITITRQRFWGTPAPIWECDKCKNYEVIGSINELKKKTVGKIPENLHKPWIDDVKIKCSKCGNLIKRTPDVLDVWLDSGTVSWNCLEYPQRKDLFKKYYPADFILEATEQTRLWFTMLMIGSVIMFDDLSYKNVYTHGMILDYKGEKMSKSLGNIISPEEVIKKVGRDGLRYYMCSNNAGENMNFSEKEAELKLRNLNILWNIHNFILDMKKNNPEINKNLKKIDIEEKYILSRLNSTIEEVTQLLDNYQIDEAVPLIEELFLDLSRTYIHMVRDKDEDIVFPVIYSVLIGVLKMFSIICPFITEKIYLNLKKEFSLSKESIHLEDWPKADKKMINKKLENNMKIAERIIQNGLACRDKAGIGKRWPLSEIVIDTKETVMNELIKKQLNVKSVKIKKMHEKISFEIDYGALGKDFGSETPDVAEKIKKNEKKIIKELEKGKETIDIGYKIMKEHLKIKKTPPEGYEASNFSYGTVFLNIKQDKNLLNEGFVNEIRRRIQMMRKKAGLSKKDKIELWLTGEIDTKSLKKEVGAEKINLVEKLPKLDYKEKYKIKSKEFEIGFKKL